jgi:hypothetical protein
MTAAQRRTSAAWLRAQLKQLTAWIDGAPHRWPTRRIVAAQRSIASGDERWAMRSADALTALAG